MKVFVLAPNEDWVCDRFCAEWSAHHERVSTPEESDVIWLLGDWCWKHVSLTTLAKKTVIATVHHIVPEKFGEREFMEFMDRDDFVDAYHVPCKKTEQQLREILKRINGTQQETRPILVQPFWVNGDLWKKVPGARAALREKLNIAESDVVVGSFQRDTEGSDLVSPKLEKGPDLFCDAVIELHRLVPELHVLLGGWRRQYVISRLTAAKVPFSYVSRPSIEAINEMYNAIDLYIVGSRYEGGPQAIVECAALDIPIVSRDVGVASEILHPWCVGDNLSELAFKLLSESYDYEEHVTRHSFNKVSPLLMPHGFEPFDQFFNEIEKRSNFSKLSPGIGSRKSDV